MSDQITPFSIRLNAEDRAALERIAKHHDRTVSNMLRHLIRAEDRRLSKQPQVAPAPAPAVGEADDFTIIDD